MLINIEKQFYKYYFLKKFSIISIIYKAKLNCFEITVCDLYKSF